MGHTVISENHGKDITRKRGSKFFAVVYKMAMRLCGGCFSQKQRGYFKSVSYMI